MDLGLKDKKCVIIGGSRGIGRSIALALADEGASIAFCARTEEALRKTRSEIRAKGVDVFAECCDAGIESELADFLDASRDAMGGVDILIHNASALATGAGPDAWTASINVDLMGAVHACSRVIPWMEEAGGGNILFISSTSGFEAVPMPDYAYTTMKAALIAYGKKLAVLHAPGNIRVNVITPGSIEFEGGVWDIMKKQQPHIYNLSLESIPSGRMGRPEEVADAAVFLVSERANWIRGTTLIVDGGQHKGIH
jgi:3-oxoacyl-[acyl-carrier protein] reductase